MVLVHRINTLDRSYHVTNKLKSTFWKLITWQSRDHVITEFFHIPYDTCHHVYFHIQTWNSVHWLSFSRVKLPQKNSYISIYIFPPKRQKSENIDPSHFKTKTAKNFSFRIYASNLTNIHTSELQIEIQTRTMISGYPNMVIYQYFI